VTKEEFACATRKQTDIYLDDVLHRKCRLEARVYLPQITITQPLIAAKHQDKEDAHRVIIALEKFAQGFDGFYIDREATEEVDDILVAHA
jgi:hypothetical protein